MTTAVCVKVKFLRKNNIDNLREWLENKNNILVTRYGRIFIDKEIFHYKQSKWHNPYKVNKNIPLNDTLKKYLNHLFTSKLIFQIEELRGKTLGCFCDHQHRTDNGKYIVMCHAQMLADILEKCGNILKKIMMFKN
jgi:hypothetical protein